MQVESFLFDGLKYFSWRIEIVLEGGEILTLQNLDLLIMKLLFFFIIDIIDPTKVAGIISQSLCRALTPHLDQLFTQGLTKIGLRVSLDPEQVSCSYSVFIACRSLISNCFCL